MDHAIEKYFIKNDTVFSAGDFNEISEAVSPSIYEVLRVIDGIPLFYAQHFDRLKESANKMGFSLENVADEIKNNMFMLINVNKSPKKNVRLVVYNLSSSKPDYMMFFIKSTYPTEKQYVEGIPTVLCSAERSNPNIKIVNADFKTKISKILETKNAYEAILVNNHGFITEGSRSNIFLVKGNALYTSPLRDVLPGVTRTNIINLCSKMNIRVEETEIKAADIEAYDALFMTGTSPKILPIASVDDIDFNSASDPLVIRLMGEFNKYISNYIKIEKRELGL